MAGPRQARSPRSSSKTAIVGHAGGHRAPVDPQGMDPEMVETLRSPSLIRKSEPAPDNPVQRAVAEVKKVVSGFGRHKNTTGNQRSPSTVLDRTKLTDAERERIARKFVDR